MRVYRFLSALTLGAAIAGAVVGEGVALANDDGAIAVVVNANVPIDEISVSQLRRVFLSEPTETGGGNRFMPLNQKPGTNVREAFDRKVLKLDADEVAKFWVDQRIRGKGKPPRAIPNAKLLLRLLPRLDGAIAYVRASEVGAGVKVLKIDGKKPGDPGYPL